MDPKARLSPPDSGSDPEEKEISDDDDDDRNHKHRRRDTHSHSLERGPLKQVSTKAYRNRNKPFENGHTHVNADSQSNETWRNFNMPPLEKDFPGKFDRRYPGSVFRAPLDLNHRVRRNQPWTGDSGSGRGRGRELGSWNLRDPRFSTVNLNPTIAQQGYVPSSLFAAQGMPSVSNAQGASWSAFGLLPGLPNGGLDNLHSVSLQRNLRGPVNHSMNIGIPHQRCRDFEERGFCLRGDMCPMEHGLNRIVIEDVQNLSQFNLPVSLPNANFMGASVGPGSLSAASAPSSSLGNGKRLYSKNSKAGTNHDGLSTNGASAAASGADFYDPDQPLWTNDSNQTSTALLALDSSKASRSDNPPSTTDDQNISNGSDNEHPNKNAVTTLGSHSTNLSPLGQIRSSENRISSGYTGNTTNKDQEQLVTVEDDAGHQGKATVADDIVSHATDLLSTSHNNAQVLSAKARCTLFVSGIPHKDNKRDAILSHFQKFGEIVKLYIPLNSERAFVQFSRREEAEDALKAPDAVMGNRFIKVWWANRDNIPVDGISTGNGVPIDSRIVTAGTAPVSPAAASKGKDATESTTAKGGISCASVSPLFASADPKPVATSGPLPTMQKRMENLDYLKELRKKQEMLDKKRNDFKRQLERLEKHKQVLGLKGETAVEQAAKRHKVGAVANSPKAATPSSIGSSSIPASTRVEMTDKSSFGGNLEPHSSKTSTVVLTESSRFKHSTHPLAPTGTSFAMNRYKLDNRPVSFKIILPLPTGLANVSALKEHFSIYGDLSTVDLEDIKSEDSPDESVISNRCARVSFTTRQSAERAFSNGKCWKGHSMQFIWLPSNNSSKEKSGKERENPSSSSRGSSDAKGEPVGEVVSLVSQISTISGDGESENSERRNRCSDSMVPDEELHSCFTPLSPKKQSSHQ